MIAKFLVFHSTPPPYLYCRTLLCSEGSFYSREQMCTVFCTRACEYGYRAMLLCDVLPGRKYKTQTRTNGPPAGYNSVEGGGDGAQLSRDTANQI